MKSDIIKPWHRYSVRRISMPLTSRSLTTGEKWNESDWIKFLERYQRPLHSYALLSLKANAQEAEEAFRDMVYNLLDRPELMRAKPGIRFRTIVRRSYRNYLYQTFRSRKNYLGVLRCYAEDVKLKFTRNADEKRYQDECRYIVKMNFLNGNDREEAARCNITEYDRLVWKSVKCDGISQIKIAEQFGKDKSSISKTLKKVESYLDMMTRAYIRD